MFHPPPFPVSMVTCFVNLFEISSHLFISLITTSLSWINVLQCHIKSSDKPLVLDSFVNYGMKRKQFNSSDLVNRKPVSFSFF